MKIQLEDIPKMANEVRLGAEDVASTLLGVHIQNAPREPNLKLARYFGRALVYVGLPTLGYFISG